MPVYVKDGKAVLHIHVPKTGGTSLTRFFGLNGFTVTYMDTGGPRSMLKYLRCPPQHMHAELITTLFRPIRFNFIFMTVRDPMARLISEYKMRVRAGQTVLSFAAFVDEKFRKYRDDPYVTENHFRPQAQFWLPGAAVFRQEDRYGDAFVDAAEAALGLTFEQREIEPQNTAPEGVRTPIAAAEIEAVRPLVRVFYAIDYMTFGYTP